MILFKNGDRPFQVMMFPGCALDKTAQEMGESTPLAGWARALFRGSVEIASLPNSSVSASSRDIRKLLPRNELVKVHDGTAQGDPRRDLLRLRPFRQITACDAQSRLPVSAERIKLGLP